MNMNKLLDQAHLMAIKAKPWVLKRDGKIYTAVYSFEQSVYEVFENGFFFLNINIKTTKNAKKFLNFYLDN